MFSLYYRFQFLTIHVSLICTKYRVMEPFSHPLYRYFLQETMTVVWVEKWKNSLLMMLHISPVVRKRKCTSFQRNDDFSLTFIIHLTFIEHVFQIAQKVRKSWGVDRIYSYFQNLLIWSLKGERWEVESPVKSMNH